MMSTSPMPLPKKSTPSKSTPKSATTPSTTPTASGGATVGTPTRRSSSTSATASTAAASDQNADRKSILEVTDSDIDEEMAKDNNNLQSETIDGFDFDTPEEFLLYHSRTGNLKVVEKLILLATKNEIELDLNCKGKQKSNYGWSPIHLAAYFGHFNVIEELLQNNADVNIVNETGDTALHKAAYTGREDIVVRLVAANADVLVMNGDGLTPREVARKESVKRILLAAEEADVKRREERFLSAARNGHIDTMRELLADTSSPLNVNCADVSGNTALHCAAYRGQKEVAVFLLKQGIDVTIKNNRGQLAAALAPNVQIKQLLHEVAPISAQLAGLRPKSVRFEGPLLKKGRFLGWRLIWAVLERGVFSFFARRADASTGTRRKGFKYLESAICEPLDDTATTTSAVAGISRPNSAVAAASRLVGAAARDTQFVIYFSDRSRALLAVPAGGEAVLSAPVAVERQKWINAIGDHIYYGTNFIKQGTRVDCDSDDDDQQELLPNSGIQALIQTANAHQSILEKHVKALLSLNEDIVAAERQLSQAAAAAASVATPNGRVTPTGSLNESLGGQSNRSDNRVDTIYSDIVEATLPSIKFHLNLILESSSNATGALSHCLSVLTHQDDVRQLLLKQEQEKVRVLEDALHVLAREHHSLEQSLASAAAAVTTGDSLDLLNGSTCYHSPPRAGPQSVCGMSDTTIGADTDEFFDAFDDYADDQLSDKTLTQSSGGGGDGVDADDNTYALDSYASLTSVYMTPIASIADGFCPQDLPLETSGGHYRQRLPAVMVPREEVSLWSILKHCIGKELSKITFPVVFNEPLTFLQRMTETLEYAQHLNLADQLDDPVERMEEVCAFIVSAYSSNWLRLNKPFNPLLGETYEYELPELNIKVVFEQVSHHPPVSAWHAEGEHFILHGTINPKLKFWGKSIEVTPEGTITLKLKHRPDVYTWKSVNCCVHNIIVGKLWFEEYGLMEVTNQTNGMRTQLNFKPAGWFGKDLHRFDGFIYSAGKEKLRFIYGKWSDYLKTAAADDYDEYLRTHSQRFRVPDRPADAPSTPRKMFSKLNSLTRQLTGSGGHSEETTTAGNGSALSAQDSVDKSSATDSDQTNGEIPKSDSSHSLDIPNSRLVWHVTGRPEHSPQYYHFTLFSMSLNQLTDSLAARLPPTDSRFRPDVRKLEDGDLESAALEKNRLEEKQRDVRRLRKKKKDQWEPLWFKAEQNPYTKEDDWVFKGDYWRREFANCPDIY